MIYSQANLKVVDVASRDPHRRALNAVHFAEDGSTVAADGRSLLAVSPINPDMVSFPDVGDQADPGEDGVSLDPITVEQALKNIPRGKPEIALAAMTRNSKGKVELTTTDLRQEQRVAGQRKREPFPDWKSTLRSAAAKATQTRICLDRKRLAALLKTLDEASGSRDQEAVVYLELGGETDAIILRAENRMTGQRVVGMMTPMNTRGRWLRPTPWERGVLGRDAKRKEGARER